MKRKRALVTAALALAAAALILSGLYRVVRVYSMYRSDMLSYESRHLDSIIGASARGIDWMLESYALRLDLLVKRPDYAGAEADYAANGSVLGLWNVLRRSDTTQTGTRYKLAVYGADGAMIAASDASFPTAAEEDETLEEGVCLRTDADGVFWFLFRDTSDGGYIYELAIPVQTVFSYHADAARVGVQGYLFLTDADGRFLAYSGGGGGSGVVSMEELARLEPSVDLDAIAGLAAGGGDDEYTVLRYPWPAENGDAAAAEETLVVTLPLDTGGGALTLGAAMSFQEFSSFLTDTLREVSLIIVLELCGALILFFIAARTLVENRRNALELEAVRERADLMEEINRQQSALAHTERLQQLGVMTSGMVHEFNNLLTPIMGQSMLLLEKLADDEESEQFEIALDIYEASENAREILRRMSSMSKRDVDMSFRTLEAGGLLRRVAALAGMAKDPHIRQELSVPDEPVCISGNDRLLTQAVLNLCINACQAMGSEGVLSISLAPERRSGHDYARIEVSDTGPGISETLMSSIYEPFVTTKGERGTGLGLSICKKIIETHKGTISAANRPEGGAVFTIRIPICAPGDDEL